MKRGKAPQTSLAVREASPAASSITSTHSTAAFILESFYARQSPRTVQSYRESLEEFARWLGEPTVLKAAGALFKLDSAGAHALVLRYSQWLQGLGASARQPALAPSSVNLRLSALRSLVTLGQQLGACTWVLKVRGPKPGRVRDVRGPGLEQVKELLAHAKRLSPVHGAMLTLMFERGLRSIEVRELQVKHLRLSAQPPTISVRGKGNTGLTALTVNEGTAAALQRLLVARKAIADELNSDPLAPDAFVFFGRKGPLFPISKWQAWKFVQEVGKAAGIKLWPHALRHSSLTALLDATNGDVRKVMKFSRHAHVQTLLRYDDDRRDVGGELAGELGKLTRGGK